MTYRRLSCLGLSWQGELGQKGFGGAVQIISLIMAVHRSQELRQSCKRAVNDVFRSSIWLVPDFWASHTGCQRCKAMRALALKLCQTSNL